MRTITKAADELGVSRTKIYSLIEKLSITTKRGSKNNLIEDSDYEKIKEIILSEKSDAEETKETDNTNGTIEERLKNVLNRDRNVLYGNVSDREYTDLKERITQLEQQIDRKDKQIQEQAHHINEKSVELVESLKANNTLIENNQELAKANTQINLMYAKVLTPPKSEDTITINNDNDNDNDSDKEASWLKKIFKRNK